MSKERTSIALSFYGSCAVLFLPATSHDNHISIYVPQPKNSFAMSLVRNKISKFVAKHRIKRTNE
jgi:hypothetical protein